MSSLLELMTKAEDAQEEEDAKLRDHFAGLAMQGFCSIPTYGDIPDTATYASLATHAYAMADAMLAARSK